MTIKKQKIIIIQKRRENWGEEGLPFSRHRPISQITRSYFRVFFTYAGQLGARLRHPYYLSLRSSQALGSNGRRKERGAQGRHPLPSRVSLARPVLSSAHYLQAPATYSGYYYLKVMLRETIRNDDF